MQPEGRVAYSVDETAAMLGCSRDLIYDLLRTKRLNSIKVGRRRLIAKDQLEDFLAQAGGKLVFRRNEHAPDLGIRPPVAHRLHA